MDMEPGAGGGLLLSLSYSSYLFHSGDKDGGSAIPVRDGLGKQE